MSKTHPLSNHHHDAPLPHDSLKSLLSLLFRPPPTPRQNPQVPPLPTPLLLTRLAHAYLASDDLPTAQRIIAAIPRPPPVFLWNETIEGCSRNGRFREAVDVYDRMLARGVRPN
ncbi:hypothetical protein MUK42_21838 [Musa troglodytarum]|uniref:Pentatricopeptide repeat-containing protein n=1 Tax=Musa troglodytarum TaxID=320322 RepID=A0A9E7G4Z7_9LILI|nr:hypothetical protein MUK42_21838 [Musa troglodytarum]